MANLPRIKGQKRGVGGGILAFGFICLILVFVFLLQQQAISKYKMLNTFLSNQTLHLLPPVCGQHDEMERSN